MSSLMHHGVKGQRWGVRRFQNKDGTRTAAGKARDDRRVLKKGSMVYRVHAAPKDYVYDNKKYVSTSIEDHNKWADYFGNEYAIRWKPVYYQRYKTKKDLYVATGKDIVDVISTKLDKQMVKRDLDSLEKEVKLRGYDWDNTSKEDHYSMLLGAQKESGKQIVHELQKMGFGAIEDDHGKNVAEDPVIVLDPDKKLRRYGKTAKDTRYLDSYRKAFNEFFATHTSMDDSPHLSHHGIKGQRWGVRRYQNKDGTRTAAGKKHYSVEAVDADSTRSDIKKLVNNFSRKDKQMFFDRHYPNEKYDRGNEVVAKRFVVKEGKDIVAFIDANERWTSDNLNIVIGTSKSARGKGYASVLSKKMVDWYEEEGHKKHGMLEWNAYEENVGSRKAAEKAGFKQISSGYDQTANYVYSKTSKKELNNLSTAYRNKSSVEKEVSDKINSDFQKTKFSKFTPKTTISAYGSAYTPYDSELGFYKSMIIDRHASKWAKKHHSEDIARYDKATSDWSSAYETFNKKRKGIKHTSIGGTMYIEGNALILGDSSYLEHHGILGQKWGVRRFQNKDGTRTAAGKARDAENLRSSQEAKNVNTKIHSYINKQLSSEDLDTGKSNFDFASHLIKDPDFEKVIMPVVQDIHQTKAKYGNKEPYEFTGDEHQAYMNDISRIDNKTGELAIAIGLAEKGEPHKKSTPPEGEYERVDMFRYALARYLDEHSPDGYSDEGDWIYHSSMEGGLFIEDGTLYLSHHGIRGQRWGVRRFQNRDGSLTNAGRKRLGYATKGAAQTVGKAFKAGVKAGGKAVKAVKAHHEKAEAKKKEKKKEKASKTRLGVMANKDLFTNEEIRKLNERFKLEDEMKMATLQKGVEIAKAVGTIAQNVGTMAKAYEDVTGQSLSPIKRKAAEEKAKQDAEDRKRKLAKEDAETKRAEDKEKRDIEDRERRIKLEDEDRVRKQAKEDADAQRAENAEKRAQAKEQRDSSMAVELQRKAKAAADEQEHKAVKAKAESRSAILDVLEKIDKIQDHDDDDHNNPPGGGIDTWDDDDYLNFFKKTGIIHSDISDPSIIQNGVLFVDSSDSLAHHGVKGQRWGVRRFQNPDGTKTEAGKKHDAKLAAKAERKQAKADMKAAKTAAKAKAKDIKLTEKAENLRKREIERYEKMAVKQPHYKAAYETMAKHAKESDRSELLQINGAANARSVIQGIGAAMILGTFTPTPVAVAGGIAIAKAMKMTNVDYARTATTNARLNREARERRLKEAQSIKLEHSSDGMLIQNGALFINAGEPYLEHHGVLGMKWGKHLRAGKGPASSPASAGGGGGGAPEEDEETKKKIEEAAKKAGMSVDEYRKKFAKEIARIKQDSAERKEGSHWALAKADVYGKTENHMPLLENKHKDKNAKEAMINNARLAETKYKAQQAAQDYTRNHTNSQKDINKWRNAAYLDSSNYLHKELAEARTEKAQQYYKNSVGGKIDRAKLKAGSALREAKAALKEGPSGVTDRIYDTAGGKYKKQAASNTKAAREDVQKEQLANRMANQQRAREASEVRKKGGRASRDKGFNTVNGHDVIAEGYRNARQKHQEAASEANAKYEKSLAGRYDKMKADRARKKSAKEKKRLLTQTSAEAKRISVKDKHLVVNGNRSAGTRGLAVGETGEKPKSFKEKAYNALGGKYKTQAADAHREMIQKRNDADDKARRANAQGRAANANKKAGNVREYMANKEGARQLDKEAKGARLSQWESTKKANRAQWKYDHSIAGLYDKATGKYKQAHKKTAVPKMMDRWNYELKDGPNSKLFKNGKGKAKTAKEQAKAEVWNAADHQIKTKEYNDVANSLGGNASYYGQAYKNAAAKEARLAEGSYRRAAAFGKQSSSETSTSSRPRARKKKYTSGGSGVTVRRPGRKPVSRTKRVTQSSTGVKRRGSTGTGRTVRRGA